MENSACNDECICVKMLGDVGLHQEVVQSLRTSLLSAQSENAGGFGAQCDGRPGTVTTGYQILSQSCAVLC